MSFQKYQGNPGRHGKRASETELRKLEKEADIAVMGNISTSPVAPPDNKFVPQPLTFNSSVAIFNSGETVFVNISFDASVLNDLVRMDLSTFPTTYDRLDAVLAVQSTHAIATAEDAGAAPDYSYDFDGAPNKAGDAFVRIDLTGAKSLDGKYEVKAGSGLLDIPVTPV